MTDLQWLIRTFEKLGIKRLALDSSEEDPYTRDPFRFTVGPEGHEIVLTLRCGEGDTYAWAGFRFDNDGNSLGYGIWEQ